MLLAHFLRDVCLGQPHEFGERRVRPAATARQRWNEASDGGAGMTIEPAQVDGRPPEMKEAAN
jgi:hypothetical protein